MSHLSLSHLVPVDLRHEAGVVLAGLAHLWQRAPVAVLVVVDFQILIKCKESQSHSSKGGRLTVLVLAHAALDQGRSKCFIGPVVRVHLTNQQHWTGGLACRGRLLVRLPSQDGELVVLRRDGAELGPRLLQLGAAPPLAGSAIAAVQPEGCVLQGDHSAFAMCSCCSGNPACSKQK